MLSILCCQFYVVSSMLSVLCCQFYVVLFYVVLFYVVNSIIYILLFYGIYCLLYNSMLLFHSRLNYKQTAPHKFLTEDVIGASRRRGRIQDRRRLELLFVRAQEFSACQHVPSHCFALLDAPRTKSWNVLLEPCFISLLPEWILRALLSIGHLLMSIEIKN